MDGFRRIMGLAAGVAAGAFIAPAHAEPNNGVTFEFAVGAEEADLMTLDYGHFGENETGRPLVQQDDGASGTRFDASVSGVDFNVFGMDAEAFLRGGYSEVSGDVSTSFAADARIIVPTGFPDFDQAQFMAVGGGGTIFTARDVEQREGEIAAGLVFAARNGLTPRVELSYRRSEIDQTVSVDRLGVTPMLEEFATDSSVLDSDCAELGLGVAKVVPLGGTWSFVADASAGIGYCSHDLEGGFDFVDNFNPYTTAFDDSLDGVNARGALSAGITWRWTDMVGLGFDVHARVERDAAHIAYPTYEIVNADVTSIGTIRIETESRAAYGARLSLRITLP
jgi:hypothetical protein